MTSRAAQWRDLAGRLAGPDQTVRERLVRDTRLVRVGEGKRAFEPGAECASYLIVLDGSVRVQIVSDSGRQIVLYRVCPGESCVLTTSCLLHHGSYEAEAVAETDVTAAAIPAATFRDLLTCSASFRDSVLASYAERVTDLIVTMEEAVFGRIERRLAALLLQRASEGAVQATHDGLAAELGTAREVVSRQLRVFADRGLVARRRGVIDLIDKKALETLARS